MYHNFPSVNCACKKCRNSSKSQRRLTHEEGLVLSRKPPLHTVVVQRRAKTIHSNSPALPGLVPPDHAIRGVVQEPPPRVDIRPGPPTTETVHPICQGTPPQTPPPALARAPWARHKPPASKKLSPHSVPTPSADPTSHFFFFWRKVRTPWKTTPRPQHQRCADEAAGFESGRKPRRPPPTTTTLRNWNFNVFCSIKRC